MNKSQVTQDTAHAKQHTDQAHRGTGAKLPRTWHTQHTTPSGDTGEQEPSGPGHRRHNTTNRAGMPKAAWEAMLADVLHPLGVRPRTLPAPQDHPYVLRRLRETLWETQRDSFGLWDITQSLAPHTQTPSPPHKRRRTDTGRTHSTPAALRATQHDAPDPPASGAAT